MSVVVFSYFCPCRTLTQVAAHLAFLCSNSNSNSNNTLLTNKKCKTQPIRTEPITKPMPHRIRMRNHNRIWFMTILSSNHNTGRCTLRPLYINKMSSTVFISQYIESSSLMDSIILLAGEEKFVHRIRNVFTYVCFESCIFCNSEYTY